MLLLEDNALEYRIEEMKLVMGYADIPDDPDHALVIPAWYMKAQGLSVPDDASEPFMCNEVEPMISALDGAPVLMAGS